MFAALFSFTLFVTLFQSVFADFTIDTPQFVQCQDAQITWTQSNPPYNLIIVPADDVCGNSLESLGDFTSLETTWLVNLASGTQVVLSLEDASGNEAWSGAITVGASNDTSCLQSSSASPTTTPPANVAQTSATSHSAAATTTYSPAGAANAGSLPASGALAIRPLSPLTIVGAAVAGAFAFAL
ncbi:hypothetical protein PISMIDRAFT_278092 [Pisolithus microcarpus 441]|uniref:Unplaced genomic scaffold scaffold_183, whole genome shotgun sequence n=1 Tax=Pisolithus microcarpus 441 TaxID=765257 RepID=A0A0C9YQP7_9AGAM|nr:hypothetical protein PISMIDRAFT_278092 [Pisolithus microcarpus 441]